VGLIRVAGDDQPLLSHPAENQLRVDEVAGAAQMDQSDEIRRANGQRKDVSVREGTASGKSKTALPFGAKASE